MAERFSKSLLFILIVGTIALAAMFGVNLPRKALLLAVSIGGGVDGALAGFLGVQAIAFAFPSLTALPIFYETGFGLYLVSYAVGFVTAFLTTHLVKYEETQPQYDTSAKSSSQFKHNKQEGRLNMARIFISPRKYIQGPEEMERIGQHAKNWVRRLSS